jgi:hypothetical protein
MISIPQYMLSNPQFPKFKGLQDELGQDTQIASPKTADLALALAEE